MVVPIVRDNRDRVSELHPRESLDVKRKRVGKGRGFLSLLSLRPSLLR